MSTPLSNQPTATRGGDSPSERPATGIASEMDSRLTSIQPGGGVVMSLELLWGRLRRRYLRSFRPGYVARMESLRHGTRGALPIEPVDPRDLKYYRNQATYWWAEEDDPFAWRDALPFVRVGLAELVLLGGAALLAAIGLGWWWWPLGLPPLLICGLILWFFRDPPRAVPDQPGAVVSPADGRLVEIQQVQDPELGPCLKFGIFLSIFNVHANRTALPGTVIAVRYRPGKMLNALRPESARENENLDIILESSDVLAGGSPPQRRLKIRQITGQFARRIVCWVRPGDVLTRGEMYGMIKLGSRTELWVPADESLEVIARVGQPVHAGSSLLARYRPAPGLPGTAP